MFASEPRLICLVPMDPAGDGWSGRAEDSVLHGCIPVVIMDEVHSVYESILDWDRFGVRINEKRCVLLGVCVCMCICMCVRLHVCVCVCAHMCVSV